MADTPIGALAVRITGDVSDFIQKFDRADKQVEKFSTKLDKRLLQPLAKVGAAAGAAAAGILLFTKRATDMVDQLGKMSQRLGVSIEALSAFKHAAALSDVSVEQLSVGLRQLSKNMADMQAGTGEARMAFRALDLSVEDSQGRLKGTEQMMLELAERFSQMRDSSAKTALAMRLFGESGAQLIPFLNQGRAGLEELRKEAERLGIVFTTETAEAARDFNDNLTRLQGAVDGLHVQLAGPLVEALNKTAEAMLKAQRNGESFFQTIVQGYRTLLTGDDAHKVNKEISDTTERLLRAQNRLDEANRRLRATPTSRFWRTEVEARRAAVEALEADLKRLQAIKPVLAPEAPAAAGGGGTQDAPAMEGEAQRKAREKLAEDLAKLDERMREAAATQAQETYSIWLEGEMSADAKAEELRQARLEALQEYHARERELSQEAAAYEIAIAREKADRERQLQQESQRKQLEARQRFVDNLAGLMNSSSKKAFEFGKKVSIAQAAVKGAQAVMDAWQAGMSTGGPWAPVVAAAYAAAAAVNAANIINNIRSQEFGGGGGTPIAPSQGSSGVSAVGAGGAGGGTRSGGQTTIVQLPGEDLVSTKAVRGLLEKLNETMRDGGRIVFQ